MTRETIRSGLVDAITADRQDEAARLLSGIRSGELVFETWRLVHLYDGLDQAKLSDEMRLNLAHTIIAAIPARYNLVLRITAPILKTHGRDWAQEFLLALQRRIETLAPSLVMGLTQPDDVIIEELLPDQTARYRATPTHALISRAWAAFCDGGPIADADLEALEALREEDYETYMIVERPVRDIRTTRDLRLPWKRRGLGRMIGPLKAAMGLSRWQGWSRANPFALHDSILRRGDLALPLEGVPRIRYTDCLLSFDRVVYQFDRPCPWLLVTGGRSGRLVGAVLPGQGILISLGKSLQYAMKPTNVARTLAAALERRIRQGRLPARAQGYGRKRVIACVAGTENFAHQIWESLPGLERAISDPDLNLPEVLRFYGTEFFGPVETLFPELADCTVEKLPNRGVNRHDLVPQTDILVNLGSKFVTESLLRRINWLSDVDAQKTPRVREIRAGLDGRGPVVWLGARANDKDWTGQFDGFLRIMEAVRARWPEARFLLDGFSYPSGTDRISHRWTGYIEAVNGLIDRLIAAGPAGAVASVSGLTLNEAISTAQWADAYVAPLGTTQHKIGWFTEVEGVIYASESWSDHVNLCRVPGEPLGGVYRNPEVVLGRPAGGNPAQKSLHDNRQNLQSVEVDVEEILRILMAQLDRREARGWSVTTARW